MDLCGETEWEEYTTYGRRERASELGITVVGEGWALKDEERREEGEEVGGGGGGSG